ncbi:hypothetical protein [Saccharothrix sp. HUAS TT1]|uniref:hypothetical protein n=1 Tax=unclassified Saccharothrix TaxID=2593673 RepID=UPI00345C4B2F
MTNPYPGLPDAVYRQAATAPHLPPTGTASGTTCLTVAVVAVDGEDGPQFVVSVQDDKLSPEERVARTHVYTAAEWEMFLADAKAGRYDDLAALAALTAAGPAGTAIPTTVIEVEPVDITSTVS